jgi:hypothetical protein
VAAGAVGAGAGAAGVAGGGLAQPATLSMITLQMTGINCKRMQNLPYQVKNLRGILPQARRSHHGDARLIFWVEFSGLTPAGRFLRSISRVDSSVDFKLRIFSLSLFGFHF